MAITVAADGRDHGARWSPGLFLRHVETQPDPVLTNIAGREMSKRGSGLINTALGLLFVLGIGLFGVSLNAQYRYVFAVKHVHLAALVESLSLDAAMAIFSLLALGLARAGKSAVVERALIQVCAAGSAAMNYAASNVSSPRSVAAYVVPPVLLAVVVDRVIAVIRKHVLGEDERSPWALLGKGVLYGLRLVLAPATTAKGVRRAVLNAAPVPEAVEAPKPVEAPHMFPIPVLGPAQPIASRPELVTPMAQSVTQTPRPCKPRPTANAPRRATSGGSKQASLIKLAIDKHGLATLPLDQVSSLATKIAPEVGIHPATARRVLLGHARGLQNGGGR